VQGILRHLANDEGTNLCAFCRREDTPLGYQVGIGGGRTGHKRMKVSNDPNREKTHGLVGWLVRLRWICLLFVGLVTAAALSQLPNLQIDNSNETFFRSGDNTKLRLDEFKETFGNDDFVFILVDVEDTFDAATLARLAEFSDRLEFDVPHLLELTWIGNVESIEGVPGGIIIDDLIPDVETTQAELERIADRALSDPLYRDRLVSRDRRTAGILLEFENYPEIGIDPRKDVPPVVNEIVAEYSDLKTHVVGGPIMDYEMDNQTANELPLWMGAALLGMCLVLALTTRSFTGVLVPAATVIIAVVWTLGLVAVIGFTLNLFVILVPTLLLCVGIGDTMHVVAEFQQSVSEGATRRKALSHTLGLVTRPIVLTTITTAAGFLAFLATDLVPLRELGVQAAIGVWVALLLTYLFAVPVLSFGRARPATATGFASTRDIFDRLLGGITSFVVRVPWLIAIVFMGVVAASTYGFMLLKIETNTIQDLPEDYPMRVAFEYVDRQMGGSMSLELIAETGREGGIKNLDVIRDIEKLQTFLDGHPLVTQTSSVVDQIKQMHRAVHENRPEYFRLPDSSNQIAEYLLLYESGGGRQLEKYVSFTYDAARIQARTKSMTLARVLELESDVEDFVANNITHADIQATGTLSLMSALGDHVRVGQAQSFALAFCAIALIMVLTLRSIPLGFIAMIPNVLPVLIALGAMGLVGAQLNMVALVLAPMILGVAVDDTVHFFVRYRRYFDAFGNYEAAYRETMRTVGRPLLFTTLVLLAGFGGFSLSIFDGPRNFAWASGVAFSSALLAEFLLAPVLLQWLKPLGPDRLGIEEAMKLRGTP